MRATALCSRRIIGPGFIAADDLTELVIGEANTTVQIIADACRGQAALPVIVKVCVVNRVAGRPRIGVMRDARLNCTVPPHIAVGGRCVGGIAVVVVGVTNINSNHSFSYWIYIVKL